MQQRTC